jgi:hypothetical protein
MLITRITLHYNKFFIAEGNSGLQKNEDEYEGGFENSEELTQEQKLNLLSELIEGLQGAISSETNFAHKENLFQSLGDVKVAKHQFESGKYPKRFMSYQIHIHGTGKILELW